MKIYDIGEIRIAFAALTLLSVAVGGLGFLRCRRKGTGSTSFLLWTLANWGGGAVALLFYVTLPRFHAFARLSGIVEMIAGPAAVFVWLVFVLLMGRALCRVSKKQGEKT